MLILHKIKTQYASGFRLCKQENGLTLLEVVICMALLSILLLAFSILFNNSLHLSNEAGRITKASFLAQKEMEELLSLSYDDLLVLGGSIKGESFPYSDDNSSDPVPLGDHEEFSYSFTIASDALEFNSRMVDGLRLEVELTLQEDGRQIAKYTTFVQEFSF